MVLVFAGCSGSNNAGEGVENNKYDGWKTASYENVKVIYPPGHLHADKMQEYARLYRRQVEMDCQVLTLPIPAETLVVYHYTGFGQGREMTGHEYPYAEDTVIHFWLPSYRGTTVMQYVLQHWINKEPQYKFLKHGLLAMLDASGQNYHQMTWDLYQKGELESLAELAVDSTVDSNLERKQTAEGASFVDFMLVQYGPKGLGLLYRAESPIEIVVPGVLEIELDSLQTNWLNFVKKVVSGQYQLPSSDSTDGN